MKNTILKTLCTVALAATTQNLLCAAIPTPTTPAIIIPTTTPATTTSTVITPTTTPVTPTSTVITPAVTTTTTAPVSPVVTTPTITPTTSGLITNSVITPSTSTTPAVTPITTTPFSTHPIVVTPTPTSTNTNNTLTANLSSQEINKNAPVITIKVGETYTFNAPTGAELYPRQDDLNKKKATDNLDSTAISVELSNNNTTLKVTGTRDSRPTEEPYPILVKQGETFTTIARVRIATVSK